MNDFQKKLELEYSNTYSWYSEYFAGLDARGIASFIMGADQLLGSFETTPENFKNDEQLFIVRRRAIVTALLQHPAADKFKGDFAALAELAGIDLPLKGNTIH